MGIEELTPPSASVVMGLDTSTQAIAFSVLHDGELKHYGKVWLEGDSIFQRCGHAHDIMRHLFKLYDPDIVVIESAIFVNNRQVVNKLSLIVGAIAGVAVSGKARMDSVTPISWQSFIGNPNLTKDERKQLKKDNPDANSAKLKKIGREIRKQRTMDLILERYDVEVTDDDVGDAIGVGWWGAEQYA